MKMKMFTVDDMRQHVQDLANAFGIDLLLSDDTPPDVGAAIQHPDGKHRAVLAKTVTDETSYAVVLHELGHHLSPLGTVRHELREKEPAPGCHPRERHRWINLKLMEEQAAWDWAQHYALCWTTAMEMVKMQTYGTYEESKRRTR
jgi:hypothetical protein